MVRPIEPDMPTMSLCIPNRVRCEVDSGKMNMAHMSETAMEAAAGSMRTFGSVPLKVGRRGPSVSHMSEMSQANIAVKANLGNF